MFADKIKNNLEKLQNLPESRKKVILWSIIAILGIIMGYFWLTGAIKSFNSLVK